MEVMRVVRVKDRRTVGRTLSGQVVGEEVS